MKDRCKDCENRAGCLEVAADEVNAIGGKLAKLFGEAGITPSFELIIALLGMVCVAAKELGMPSSNLMALMVRANERLSVLSAPSEALKDLPPNSQVH